MAMREQQEPRSPRLETTQMASDEQQLAGLGPMTGGSAAAMATADMACGGGGEEEQGPDGAPDKVCSSSPWVALLPDVGSTSLVSICSTIASPQFQRKRRSHVPRAALSHQWSLEKLPVLPPAAAKKKARRKRASEVEPEPAAAAPAPGNEEDKPEKWCLHCGITSTLQWRMGPRGKRTLCNPCGVRYRQGRLMPEYRPKASPTFIESKHSNQHRAVLQIRQLQDDPAPPAPYLPIRSRRQHHKGKGQQQPAEVRKKRKVNKEENQPAQAQPTTVPVLQGSTSLPAEPALLKLCKRLKGKEPQRKPPQPAATQPRASNDILQMNLPPPPPPELPHPADGMDQMAQHLTPPPAQPHAGVEPMTDEPLPPPDPFLFEGPAAPMIIDDDEPVVVIVIDDD